MHIQEAPKRIRVIETFSLLAVGISIWLSMVLFIELAPKLGSAYNSLRLLYVCLYFAAWICFWQHVRRAAPTFLWHLLRWRFEYAPPSMAKAWKSMLEEGEFLLVTLAWACKLFVGSTGLLVLSSWFNVPGLLNGSIHLAWWLSILTLLGITYCLPASLVSIFKQYRFLRRQVDTCDFYSPRPLTDLWRLSSEAADTGIDRRHREVDFWSDDALGNSRD